MKEIARRSFESLRSRYASDTELYRLLDQTTSKELARIAADPWVSDPKDDHFFWTEMASYIQDGVEPSGLLKKIIARYLDEIRSSFSIRHYQLIVKGVQCVFVNLLKPKCFGFGAKKERWTLRNKRLHEKFHITGAINTIRSLAEKGTIVLVPNHTSNWDSVVMGLAMQRLGLPPLSWGAGLNLFNNKGFRYIFSKLGTYKVDRRKKTIPYLQAQKDYACLMLEWNCHTLFYPGGTRSRSGTIESDLKFGLLGTPFEAQAKNFKKYGADAKKFFIVPIVLNYHCVLEAQQLIRESDLYEQVPVVTQDCCHKNLVLTNNMLFKGSEIFINIGVPLDVMGNQVDEKGHSYDSQGKKVDLYEQFFHFLEQAETKKRRNDHVNILGRKIVENYYKINTVLSSHLVAFVAYELAKKVEGFSMHLAQVVINREIFMLALAEVYKALCALYEQEKIAFTPVLINGQLNAIVVDGLSKLGIYHDKPPLVTAKNGDVLIQDIWTLLYYHNRLTGYGLETKIV
ncbi:1-acyl-sn-glycerol-3-phosphate acyltransferase [Cardinium endosymbiont of Tipula unca]|uniref:1-acyl-sn-glycerol-3-phosphate acyltransferase n=1 Tax=Cardinium endosymbiont of Tipula unca TaxID=3066216 RepID=UPI0030D1CB66